MDEFLSADKTVFLNVNQNIETKIEGFDCNSDDVKTVFDWKTSFKFKIYLVKV